MSELEVQNTFDHVSYWLEYSSTLFSHEICPEMGVGLYTGANFHMKLPIKNLLYSIVVDLKIYLKKSLLLFSNCFLLFAND